LQKTSWLPLILCPFAIVTILIVTRDPGSNALPIVEATSRFVHGESIVNNLVAYGTHWVVALPFAVPWLLLRWRSIVKQPVIYVALPAAWLGSRGLEGPSRWVGITAAVGAAALGDLLLDGWKRRDAVDLGLAAWLALPLAVVPYLQLPSKFLVAAAPAAALAVARALSRAPAVRARAVLAGTVLAGAVLGILILRADAVFAGLGRRAAAELIPSTGAIARTIWFDGHWGFQWYAEKAGARPLSLEPPSPEARDLIVSSDLTGLGFLDHFPTRRLLATVTETRPGGRVMSRAAGAGFFTNDFGLLPWAWGNDTLDRYDLWVLDPVSTP
jgi:hypothetical protein